MIDVGGLLTAGAASIKCKTCNGTGTVFGRPKDGISPNTGQRVGSNNYYSAPRPDCKEFKQPVEKKQ